MLVMSNLPDVDIDCKDRDKILALIKHIPACIIKDGGIRKHPTGVYVQDIPYDPGKNHATIDYKVAEDRGYFKLDFLNNGTYDNVRDEAHLDELLNTEPRWELLEHEEFVAELPHIGNYFDIVRSIRPSSIYDLAVILALIRPGKRHLVHKHRDIIESDIWDRPTNGEYYFKKAHSISYAATIVIAMNLLVEGL